MPVPGLTAAQFQAFDWVTLDDGEEFSVGAHRFRAERAGSIALLARDAVCDIRPLSRAQGVLV